MGNLGWWKVQVVVSITAAKLKITLAPDVT